MHHKYREPDEVMIQRLWDKIKATFAEREDVLKLCIQLERIERNLFQKKEYEDWIESDCIDKDGKRVKIYNDSQNAVSTAAAATIIKSLRKDIEYNKRLFQLVFDVDKNGQPVIPEVNYNTIYLTPCDNKKIGKRWDEWIAIPNRPGAPKQLKPYTWERIGTEETDLTGICNDIVSINSELIRLNKKIHTHSAKLADAMLENAIKPLRDLKEYINSPEYIQYVFEKFPKAAIGQDGLMTSGMVAVLNNLAVWAANDYKTPGGGALGEDAVIHMLQKVGIPVKDLQQQFQHACPDCVDELF